MTATLLIVSRELRSRRAVFVAALCAGLLTLAAPLLPWVEPGSAADARVAMALVFAAAFTGGTAVAHGATMVATDLKERRLGYYFARPLAGTAIWAGKLIAGLLLALGSGLLALLPAAAVARGQLTGWFEAGAVPFVVGGTLLLLGVAHLVAVAIASRSRLIVLDLVALVVVCGAGALILRRLVAAAAFEVLVWAVVGLAVTALALVLAAGWAQVAAGRCDPVRGHRFQSAALWGGLGATVLLLGALTAFVTGATPASLRAVENVQAAGSGSWVAVQGPARWRGGYRPSFLVDTDSGRFIRLATVEWWELPVAFSADGRVAAWLQPVDPIPRRFWELKTLDLTSDGASPGSPPVVLRSRWPGSPQLSPDGRHVALLEDRRAVVYELPDGRLRAASTELPDGKTRIAFVDDDRLRVEVWTGLNTGPRLNLGELTIGVLHLHNGRFEVTATAKLDLAYHWYRVLSPTARRMVLVHRTDAGKKTVIHDSWTAEPVARLSPAGGLGATWFLDDGRFAMGGVSDGRGWVEVFDPEGTTLARHDLGPARRVTGLGEPSLGRLLTEICLNEPGCGHEGDAEGAVVDLATGAVQHLGRGRVPFRGYQWVSSPLQSAPGSLASRLLLNPEGGLEALDPETGATRHLLGPR